MSVLRRSAAWALPWSASRAIGIGSGQIVDQSRGQTVIGICKRLTEAVRHHAADDRERRVLNAHWRAVIFDTVAHIGATVPCLEKKSAVGARAAIAIKSAKPSRELVANA